jgi:hypothetical protein
MQDTISSDQFSYWIFIKTISKLGVKPVNILGANVKVFDSKSELNFKTFISN